MKCLFRLDEYVRKDCQLTHSNPIVINVAQFYVRLLVGLLKGYEPTVLLAVSKTRSSKF
jgi:hypothetical protein